MKKIITFILVLVMLSVVSRPALANTFSNKEWICHNGESIYENKYNHGHYFIIWWIWNDGHDDYFGKCVEIEPTSSPVPTESPQPSESPQVTATPKVTSAPTYLTTPPLGSCFGKWDKPITQSVAERTSPTTALIDYVPTTGEGEHLNVVYSESWFEVVIGLGAHAYRDHLPNNGQDVPLNDLVPGQSYFYRLQNGCSPWGSIFELSS